MIEQQPRDNQEVFLRCQHIDEKRQPDCWNVQANECFHCKWWICEHHTRRKETDGWLREYCVVCYESPQLSFGMKKQ